MKTFLIILHSTENILKGEIKNPDKLLGTQTFIYIYGSIKCNVSINIKEHMPNISIDAEATFESILHLILKTISKHFNKFHKKSYKNDLKMYITYN